MPLTRIDQAKYPFVSGAAEEVKKEKLDIENLENPMNKSILVRAQERIEEALRNDPPKVSYQNRKESIEIPSFPVAILLTAASNSKYIKRRYALAEARRAYDLLRVDTGKNILEVSKTFKWRIIVPEKPIGNRKFNFAIYFVDYLKNTTSFNEPEWKLINRVLLDGKVYLNQRDTARLLQEEIRRRIESRVNVNVRSLLSLNILERIDKLQQKYAEHEGRIQYSIFPKTVKTDAFPLCIKLLYSSAESGSHISHLGRFSLTSFLLNVGMKSKQVLNLFRPSSDFSERIARYQVEHIAGERGSRTKYRPPTCDTLKTHGLCPGPDEICKTIRNPLRYYGKKTGILKKEVSGN